MPTLEELKGKYAGALERGTEVGLRLENLHMTGDKMFVKGVVPSEFAKNEIWDAIKRVDPGYADLTADFRVQSGEVYTVQSGDTLSKIAKRFYGQANLYPKIFEANRDQLKDPDKIQVGQKLKLP